MLLSLAVVILLGILIATMLIILGRQLVFAVTMLHGPVFVPSADDKLQSMLKLAKPKKGEKIVDLGSGDGKVVFALAKRGYTVEGIEINPLLVSKSRKRAKELGLDQSVTFTRKSFWNVNFSEYDLLLLYGTTYIMKKLEQKLLTEMHPGARLVSNYFQFPTWKPEAELNDVRVYRVPKSPR